MTHDTPAPDASFLIERMNTWSQRAISEKRRAEAAEAEIARLTAERDALRAALQVARRSIMEGGGGGVTCTVWVPTDVCPSETLVDHIDAAVNNSTPR